MLFHKWSLFFTQDIGQFSPGKAGSSLSYAGINLESVKNNNRSAILKLLNDQGAMSRKDIAAALGLTPATVTVICSDLLTSQILCELGEAPEDKRAGRRKILIGINYDRWRVLSISVESAETCVSLTNLRGGNGAFRRIQTNTSLPPAQFLRQVANLCLLLLEEENVPRSSVLGVGVSVPGEVDRKEGLSVSAYRVWNEPVNVGECLERHLGMPVLVENNVRAFAEAELIYGCGKDVENMLFIKWGPGVGSSIVIHKQIYDSNPSKNAEIGHFVIDAPDWDRRCCRRGLLETFVGTHAMADQLRERCTRDSMPQLYGMVNGDLSAISAHNFTRYLCLEDPEMWRLLDFDVDLLARSVCNVITMLAPDKVIVYGKLFEQPALMERFMARCRAIDPRYGEAYITHSELRDKIDYIGPLALVVNSLFLSGQAE